MEAAYKTILSHIKNKQLKKLYFIHGDESFYIDAIDKAFTQKLLTPEEQEFDSEILYGKDVKMNQIISSARQYPMIGSHRLVLVREAQNIKDFKELEEYIKKPAEKSILVFAHKEKKFDARKEKKLASDDALFFFAKKLYDNQIPDWIIKFVSTKGYSISPKSAQIISDYLGNELTKISNELQKVLINLPKGTEITDEIIEKNIGLSKDYNIFEFSNAVAKKDIQKANTIINYFANNSKNHPFVITCNQLYRYFSNLLLLHMNLKNNNPGEISAILKINQFFTKEYQIGLQNYNRKKVAQVIHLLSEYDLKSKGVNNPSTPEGELLKELTYKIMH